MLQIKVHQVTSRTNPRPIKNADKEAMIAIKGEKNITNLKKGSPSL